jgi:hypothetical protein
MKRNVYWFPWSIPGVADLINSFCKPNDTKVIILYGEVYVARFSLFLTG